MGSKKADHMDGHLIKIEHVPNDVYERMWNLRRRREAKSWLELITIFVDEMEAEIKEQEWI